MKTMKNKMIWLYAWYKSRLLRPVTLNAFGWNQVADLGIILVVLFVVIQNNNFLGTAIQAVYTDIQGVLTSLINSGKL